MADFNPDVIKVPVKLEGRKFLSFEEFGSLIK